MDFYRRGPNISSSIPHSRRRPRDRGIPGGGEFFGGVFNVLIPDNIKAIIAYLDPLAPHVARGFLEDARHFHIDAARVRHARDKARASHCTSRVRSELDWR